MNKKDIENSLRRYTRNGQADWITLSIANTVWVLKVLLLENL